MKYLKLVSPKTFQFAFDYLALSLIKKRGSGGGEKRKVCLLRLDGLGDVILFADAIRVYRELFDRAEHELTLITEDWIAPLFEECPNLDRVIGCQTMRYKIDTSYRREFLRGIRKSSYSVFINSCIERELHYGDNMAQASGAKYRLGFSPSPQRIREKVIGNLFYTTLAPYPGDELHETEKIAKLANFVAGKAVSPQKPRLGWFETADKGDYFIIAPGTRGPLKKWPEERFVQLCKVLYEEMRLTPVIVGGKDDVHTANSITAASGGSVPFDNRVGKLDLPSVARLIAGARFFVGNDSGPSHLSAAVGTKTFMIVHGASYRRYVSYPERLGCGLIPIHQEDTSCFNCAGKCRYKVNEIFPCVEKVTVKQAKEIILGNC